MTSIIVVIAVVVVPAAAVLSRWLILALLSRW